MTLNGVSVFDLPPAAKLQLIEDLWEDLATTTDTLPLTDEQKAELARRRAKLEADPSSAVSWEEAKRRIRSRYGR
ncbi:MAG: addiction module protein [Gemmataceae bacterium]|nr:addiction module protein [Gemmataceae bacterium]